MGLFDDILKPAANPAASIKAALPRPRRSVVPSPVQPDPTEDDIEIEPDEPGLMQTIGDILDRPGNAVRGLMSGRLDGLNGLVPFGETMGVYDRKKNHTAGTELVEAWTGIKHNEKDGIFSGTGLAGLGAELITDPTNLFPGFFGLKTATKAGGAAAKVASHLDEAGKVAKEYKYAKKAMMQKIGAAEQAGAAMDDAAILAEKAAVAKRFKDAAKNLPFKNIIDDADEILGDRKLLEQLAESGTPLGEAAREVLENARARGLGDDALRLADDAGEKVKRGQEAFMQVGGPWAPGSMIAPALTAAAAAPFMGPAAIIPALGVAAGQHFVPGLKKLAGASIDLPQKTLIEGAGASQAFQDIGRGFAGLAPVRHTLRLFDKNADLDARAGPQQAEIIRQAERKMRSEVAAADPAIQKQAEELSGEMVKVPGMMDAVGHELEHGPRLRAEAEAEALLKERNADPYTIPPDVAKKALFGDEALKPLPDIAPEPLPPGAPVPSKLAKARQALQSAEARQGVAPVDLQDQLLRAERTAEEARYRATRPMPSSEIENAERMVVRADAEAARLRAMMPETPAVAPRASSPEAPVEARPTPDMPMPGAPAMKSKELLEQEAELARITARKEAILNKHSTVDTSTGEIKIQNSVGKDADKLRMAEAQVTRQEVRVAAQGYIDDAGQRSAQAIDDVRKAVPETMSPGAAKTVEAQFKDGKTPDAVIKIAGDINAEYEHMIKIEEARGLKPTELREGRVGYTTHVPTDMGEKILRKMARNRPMEAKVFIALEQLRRNEGVAANVDALKTGTDQRAAVSAAAAPGKSKPLPAGLDYSKNKLLSQLTPEQRAYIIDRGLVDKFTQFAADDISTVNPSHFKRMEAYSHLGVDELNKVFKEHGGATGSVFNTNPAAQLATRKFRHAKQMAGATFLDGAAEAGKETDQIGVQSAAGEGLVEYPGLPGQLGITKLNDIRAAQGLKAVAFDAQTAQAILEVEKSLTPDALHPMLEAYDQITRTFKAYILPFPATVVRNHIGNRIQAWLGGVPPTGEHYMAANKIVAGRDVLMTMGDGRTMTRDEIMKDVIEDGLTRGNFFENELTKQLDLSADKESWNPLSTSFPFLKAENKILTMAQRGSAVLSGGAGHLMAGGAPKDLLKLSSNAIEDADRIGAYLYYRQQGFTRTAATEKATKYLFDYSAAARSPFEEKYARRALFFYTYTRNVLPLMIETLLTNPGKVSAIARLSNQPGQPDHKPTYAREGLSLRTGTDGDGNATMMYSLGTPVESAVEPFAGFAEGGQRGAEKLLSMLNPLLKIPLELATGQDFFLGRPIDSAKKAPHYVDNLPQGLQDLLGAETITKRDGTTKVEMDPFLLYGLRNNPFSRVSNTASRLADERKGAGEQALNLLTGSRIVSIDEEEERERAIKAAQKKRKAVLAADAKK